MAKSTKDYLGGDPEGLLTHVCTTIPKEHLHLPGPDMVDRIYVPSDRNNRVLGNLEWIFQHGRLGGSGYMSILPWTRASSTRRGRRSRRIRPTSIRRTS